MRVKIVYVFHNCFALMFNDKVLVFDYPELLDEKVRDFVRNIVRNKELLVMISHSHMDHFSKEFLKLKNYAKRFTCIISRDVGEVCNDAGKQCREVSEGEELSLDGILIKVLGSSDLGVSYFLKMNDLKVYFAGDNSDWRRPSLPKEFNKIIWRTFSRVVEELRRDISKLDVLFANLCVECNDYGGLGKLCKTFNPKLLVPMHLRGNIEVLKQLSSFLKQLASTVFLYERTGDNIVI